MRENGNALAQLRLCCELLCDSRNKKHMSARLTALVSALQQVVEQQKMTDKRVEALTTALFLASDATQDDFEIVDGKVYIETPMIIDPQVLAQRVIW